MTGQEGKTAAAYVSSILKMLRFLSLPPSLSMSQPITTVTHLPPKAAILPSSPSSS